MHVNIVLTDTHTHTRAHTEIEHEYTDGVIHKCD